MQRLGYLILTLATVVTGCDTTKKLGVAGSTCGASSDCTGDLQCIASTCVDATALAAGAKVQEDLAAAKLKAARSGTLQMQGACERFLLEKNDKCPTSAADLKAANIIRVADLKDPWGQDYVLTCPGEHGPVDVTSNGPDQKAGSGDDIHSWDKP